MNADHELERRVRAFYEAEPPLRAPDRLVRSIAEAVDTVPQRRGRLWDPLRYPPMHASAKVAIAAVLFIAVGALGIAVLRPDGDSGFGPVPSAPPSPSPSAAPSADVLPPLTKTFASTLHGIDIGYPSDWTVVARGTPWVDGLPNESADEIGAPGSSTFIRVASQPLGPLTGPAWMDMIATSPDWVDTCPITTEDVVIDGVSGRIVIHCPDTVLTALVTTSGRGYSIVLYDLADLDGFRRLLQTVRLRPDDAVDATASPASSGSAVPSPS